MGEKEGRWSLNALFVCLVGEAVVPVHMRDEMLAQAGMPQDMFAETGRFYYTSSSGSHDIDVLTNRKVHDASSQFCSQLPNNFCDAGCSQ
jgi:hypothetical protein